MQDQFAESILNIPHKVCGRVLQPFSAAHLLYMEATGCAVMGGKPVGPRDMLTASAICSQPVKMLCGTYRVDDPKPMMLDGLRLFRMLKDKSFYAIECVKWHAYCEDYLAMPEKMQALGKDSLFLSAPMVIATAVQGCRLVGEERAWSMPFGLLHTIIEVDAETQGAEIRFCPDSQEVDEIERQLSEADKAGAKFLHSLEEAQYG